MNKQWRSIPIPTLVFACILLLTPQISLGDDADLLRKYATAYRQYEGIRISGKVTKSVAGKEVETMPFQANYGHSTATSLRPYEVGLIVKNPGEPHLDDPYLFERCFSVKNFVAGEFERNFISTPPHRFGMSRMHLRDVIHYPDIYYVGHLATQFGIDGFPMDATWGNTSKVLENLRLEVLGEETFQGFPCKRVRFTYLKPDAKGLSVEMLIADSPTVQVLEVVRVACDDPAVVDAVNPWLLTRKVKQLQVIDNRLIPTHVVFTKDDEQFDVTISKVEPLPSDYSGTWDYESLTGTVFTGPADATTRDDSKRVKIERYTSVRPFTEEETEKIRQYRLAKEAPVESESNGLFRIVLILANVAVVVAIGVAWWSRKRKSSQ